MQERLNGSPTAIHSLLGESTDSIPSPERSAEPIPRPNGPASRRPTLMNVSLDLKAIPRDDGPPSETQLRRQKFQFFESKCSEISEGLFLSGEVVARNEGLLKEHGITHVVNCVGMICQEYFKDQGMTYRTYFLHDTPGEDILAVLYDALEFVDGALRGGGRVLVHCSQGVSRSATIVIAYLMWRTGRSYDEVYASVKEARGVANPNIGFTCQLLQWQKRRQPHAAVRTRMYRVAPHCKQAPGILVAKSVASPKHYPSNTYRELDSRGAFIIHGPSRIFTWVGSNCPDTLAAAARYHARLLLKFEGQAGGLLQRMEEEGLTHEPAVVETYQGLEPPELAELIDPPALDDEAVKTHARRMSQADELALASARAPAPSFPPPPLLMMSVPRGQPLMNLRPLPESTREDMVDEDVDMVDGESYPDEMQTTATTSSHYDVVRSNGGYVDPSSRARGWEISQVDDYTVDYDLLNQMIDVHGGSPSPAPPLLRPCRSSNQERFSHSGLPQNQSFKKEGHLNEMYASASSPFGHLGHASSQHTFTSPSAYETQLSPRGLESPTEGGGAPHQALKKHRMSESMNGS